MSGAGPLSISHAAGDGTLVAGTARGDGSAEVLRARNLRWSRSLRCWYVPRSRGRHPDRVAIEALAEALRAVGFDVDVRVDEAPRAVAEVEADRAARLGQRCERLQGIADRETERAESHDGAARAVIDGIPLGQPILVGHHSERRHRRDLERVNRHLSRRGEHLEAARGAQLAADAAGASTSARMAPTTVANRVERLAAEARRLKRLIQEHGQHELWALALVEVEEQLGYWRGVREQQLIDGTAAGFGPSAVKAGDAVKISGRWRRVVRANTKSVTVATEYSWTDRAPWHHVTDHQPAPDVQPAANITRRSLQA